MNAPVRLVPYGVFKPTALIQQMAARVDDAIADGRDVAVIACVAVKGGNGNWVYRQYWSPQPAEIMLMAAHELMQRASQ
jgi:hypothetical protein